VFACDSVKLFSVIYMFANFPFLSIRWACGVLRIWNHIQFIGSLLHIYYIWVYIFAVNCHFLVDAFVKIIVKIKFEVINKKN
jgi:hypothetical protein